MRKLTYLLPALVLVGLSFSTIDNRELQVKKAAQEQLQAALSGIPAGQETNFGFSSREEFKNASPGEVYRTISLTKEFYIDENVRDKDYIKVLNEWRVPVVVNGENRMLLTVFGTDTVLKITDMGGVLLAKEMQEKSIGQSAKEKFIFRIYPLTMDFIVFAEHGKDLSTAQYFPMNSAMSAIPSLTGKALTQEDVLRLIKAELAKPAVKH